jgi:DNA-directed RNA polymerase
MAKLNLNHPAPSGRLDYIEARKGISANFTHSIDAAFLAQVVGELAEDDVPVGTVHDCIAVRPHEADHLCSSISRHLCKFYEVDHLSVMRLEIQATTGILLPELPMVGTLDPSEIGQNPYAFC